MQRFKNFIYTFKRTFAIAYKVNPSLVIMVSVSNSILGLTNLPILYISKALIDLVIDSVGNLDISSAIKTVVILALLRAFIELLRSVLSEFNWSLSASLAEQIQAKIELIAGEKLNTLDIPTIESSKFQDRYKKVEREANNRVWETVNRVFNIPGSIFTIISGLIPLFYFKPWLAIVVIIIGLPDIFISSKIIKKDYEEGDILNPKWRMWGFIKWHLTDVKNYYENRILGGTRYLVNKLSSVQTEVMDYRFKRRVRRSKMRLLGSIPGFLFSGILNTYFFVLAIIGRISLGSAQLLYSASSTLTNGFSNLIDDGVKIYENYLFITDLAWFLDLEPKTNTGNIDPNINIKLGFEFNDVWFKYPNTKESTLKGVNFTIGLNENIALVGENGAGKTTLIKLLCGFYQPTKGEILFNGINIENYHPVKYRAMISALFQNFSEYSFSAKESIGIGSPERINQMDGIKSAAKMTGIDKFIKSLPLGYETPITKEFDKGVEPSKGQWQRIALARILFRDSKIVILDEPTSNVDPKAEEEIFDKIINLSTNKMLILISHRFSTVRKVNKILNLDNGVIIEQGSHEELMGKNGEYSKLFKLQAKGYQ